MPGPVQRALYVVSRFILLCEWFSCYRARGTDVVSEAQRG